MHAPPPEHDPADAAEDSAELAPRLDLPSAEAEQRLDAALAAPELSPELHHRLLAMAPTGAVAAAEPEAPAVAGRIGFGPRGGLVAGLAAAAAIGLAAFVGIGLLGNDAEAPGTDALALGPAPTVVASDPPLDADPIAVATSSSNTNTNTTTAQPDELLDADGWPEQPALVALAEAASASGLPMDEAIDAPSPGSAAHRLAELEAASGNPWARSAWAAVEADALFAEGPSTTSLF